MLGALNDFCWEATTLELEARFHDTLLFLRAMAEGPKVETWGMEKLEDLVVLPKGVGSEALAWRGTARGVASGLPVPEPITRRNPMR